MFCARCGQQIPEASELCPLCGREATIKLEPQPVLPGPTVLSAPQVPAFSLPQAHLRGVRGWLLFFCISVTILTPLGNLTNFRSPYLSHWNLYYLIVILSSLVVGASVWLASSHALLLLKAYFIGFAIWEVLRIAYVVFALHNSSFDSPMAFRIRSLIWITIWATYFHKSQRVRATFGRNL